MKSSRIFNFLAAITMTVLLSLTAVSNAHADSLLWRVEQGGVHVGYVFGTMHVDDARVIALPQPVFDALDASTQFVAEISLEPAAMAGMLGRMFYRDGTGLADHLTEEQYRQAITLLEKRGMPEYSAKYLKLWAAYTVLIMPAPTTGQFVDLLLHQRAQSSGARTRALETVDEQLDLFESLGIDQQRELVISVLDDPDVVAEEMEQMKQIYMSNDLRALERFSEQHMGDLSGELKDWFENAMVADRNRLMVERLLPMLEEHDGKTFVAVGALHLPASHGLVNGLREQGYTLRPINISWE